MSVETGQAKLNSSLKALHLRWSETRQAWTDEKAAEFDRERIAPLEASVRAAIAAMGHMASVLDRMRKDCR